MNNIFYDADRAVAAALQSHALQQNGLLQAIGRDFNWWGGPGVIWLAAIMWLGGRALKNSRISLIGLRGAEAIAVASALNGILKGLTGRVRPFVTPGEPWYWSFNHGWRNAHYQSMPSGHTAATIAFAAALTVASSRLSTASRIRMSFVAFASGFLVAFARLYTNQHWFSDVLAAVVLGAAVGFLLTRWHEQHPRTAFDRVMLGAAAAEKV